jgi:hypothetical protein
MTGRLAALAVIPAARRIQNLSDIKTMEVCMQTLETLPSIANLWSDDGNAVSFYFSELHPDNLAHKSTLTTAKDHILELMHERHYKPPLRDAMHDIVDRLAERAVVFRESHPLGIAIFATPEPEFWQELELNFKVSPASRLGNSFVMAPLLPAATHHTAYYVILIDRSVTRFFYIEGEVIVDKTQEFGEPRFPVRETGTLGDTHIERHKDKFPFLHLREVGERLFRWLQKGDADHVYIGCRDELYPEIQAAVPDNVNQLTLGHFHCDPALTPTKEVQALVEPLIAERTRNELRTLLDEVIGEAKAGRRGAVGPKDVITALELGEIESLIVTPHSPTPANICTSCGHMDLGTGPKCSLTGDPVHVYEDLEELCARRIGKGSFDVRMDTDLAVPGNGYLAKLRFRVDQRIKQSA